MIDVAFRVIADENGGGRPYRAEPRVRKRRPKAIPRMYEPRDQLSKRVLGAAQVLRPAIRLEIAGAVSRSEVPVRKRLIWTMRRAFLLLPVLAAPLAVGLLPAPGRADSPLPPPARTTIWSNSRRFFAITEPKDSTTTVYRATPDGKGIKCWAMFGYVRFAWLAADGEHLVADPFGWSGLVPLDYDRGHVVLYFFRRGELLNKLTLGQLQAIGGLPKLPRTASHYTWGHPVGFNQDGYFVIETVENRAIRLDASKGEPLIHTRHRSDDDQILIRSRMTRGACRRRKLSGW